MTILLNLRVAVLDPGLQDAEAMAAHIVSNIAAPFEKASGHDIALKVTLHAKPWAGDYAGVIGDSPMHDALEEVTGYQRWRNRVNNIGLLVGDQYDSQPDYFGLMFDGAFRPSDTNLGPLTPREGCAVFLGAIRAKRSGSALRDEVLYTAIHELGHVFNLQHGHVPSYMATSAGNNQPYKLSETAFSKLEAGLLARCSTDPHIWPGGSAFEDLGTLASANTSKARPGSQAPVCLRIAMSKSEFWAFEPIELDLALTRNAVASRKSPPIPEELDPGHSNFVIWIEEPDGSRRSYRPPNRFCSATTKVSLSQPGGYRRDISIFGESGAYTFRKAGVHRVWVAFKINNSLTIRSDIVECNVLAQQQDVAFHSLARPLFTSDHVANLLFHRRLNPGRLHMLKRLKDFCDLYPRHASVGMARYAMGRALAALATQAKRNNLPHSEFDRRAGEQLRLCIGNRCLGDHRVNRAEEVLGGLD
jgi:hypothetical protein